MYISIQGEGIHEKWARFNLCVYMNVYVCVIVYLYMYVLLYDVEIVLVGPFKWTLMRKISSLPQ